MPIRPEQLKELRKEIPYQWRVQTQNETTAVCVAYVDARDVQNLMDEVLGPENWDISYQLLGDQLFARIGINILDPTTGQSNWVYKMDAGTESKTEAEKGLVSDCAKRCSVVWGVGRFLYNQEIQRLEVKKHTNGKFYPCDNTGKILWNGDELTKYINQKLDSLKKNTLKNVIPWSKEVQDKASKVEKNGIKGSVCLTKYIPEYNKAKGTKYNDIMQLKTDKELLDLIKFVENLTPESMK